MGWEEEEEEEEEGVDLGIIILLSTFTKYISLCENPMFPLMNWILFFKSLNFQ
jgi:hypothetical protein